MGSPPFLPSERDRLPPNVRADYETGMVHRLEPGRPDAEPCFWLKDACLGWRETYQIGLLERATT